MMSLIFLFLVYVSGTVPFETSIGHGTNKCDITTRKKLQLFVEDGSLEYLQPPNMRMVWFVPIYVTKRYISMSLLQQSRSPLYIWSCMIGLKIQLWFFLHLHIHWDVQGIHDYNSHGDDLEGDWFALKHTVITGYGLNFSMTTSTIVTVSINILPLICLFIFPQRGSNCGKILQTTIRCNRFSQYVPCPKNFHRWNTWICWSWRKAVLASMAAERLNIVQFQTNWLHLEDNGLA